jgi:uncharacterized membrane protein
MTFGPDLRTFGGIVVLVLMVWLIYLSVKVAQHVDAWPL